eukprot:m.292443 g.292443  ORF g.292443 m.292443 type:complete len:106 (-) comp15841_c0_seq1:5351-5668(-)
MLKRKYKQNVHSQESRIKGKPRASSTITTTAKLIPIAITSTDWIGVKVNVNVTITTKTQTHSQEHVAYKTQSTIHSLGYSNLLRNGLYCLKGFVLWRKLMERMRK